MKTPNRVRTELTIFSIIGNMNDAQLAEELCGYYEGNCSTPCAFCIHTYTDNLCDTEEGLESSNCFEGVLAYLQDEGEDDDMSMQDMSE